MVRPGSFARPPSFVSSMKNEIPMTSPPRRSASSAAAAAVPPVASTSSRNQDLLAPRQGVGVDLEAVAAVLEAVGDALGCAGKLAGFPHRDETDLELARQGRAEHEAPRLDAKHFAGPAAPKRHRHLPHGSAKRLGRRQERRDVFEEDAGAREVRHVPHVGGEIRHGLTSKVACPAAAASSSWSAETLARRGPSRSSSK